jgi:hypothetical protein
MAFDEKEARFKKIIMVLDSKMQDESGESDMLTAVGAQILKH